MQPIVFKYANAIGKTDFKDGLAPKFPMKDNLLQAVPFGDLSDPLLATALEQITGVAPVVKKSALMEIPYTELPDPKRDFLNRSLTFDREFQRISD
jgi:hypothetical protein